MMHIEIYCILNIYNTTYIVIVYILSHLILIGTQYNRHDYHPDFIAGKTKLGEIEVCPRPPSQLESGFGPGLRCLAVYLLKALYCNLAKGWDGASP
jgi:hypothetical protein